MPELQKKLQAGLDELGMPLQVEQIEKLMAYLALLSKWNKVYNLTAIRRPEEMLTHHLLDSLAAIPALVRAATRSEEGGATKGLSAEMMLNAKARVLDVGSGGGLPGIPLAICCPQMQVVSVDTVQKKVAFQTQVKAELGLKNFTVHAARVETITPEQCGGAFDVVTSRAFAELKDFVVWANHLVAPSGCFMALKGVYPEDELTRISEGWRLAETTALVVPQLDVQRHIVKLERVSGAGE